MSGAAAPSGSSCWALAGVRELESCPSCGTGRLAVRFPRKCPSEETGSTWASPTSFPLGTFRGAHLQGAWPLRHPVAGHPTPCVLRRGPPSRGCAPSEPAWSGLCPWPLVSEPGAQDRRAPAASPPSWLGSTGGSSVIPPHAHSRGHSTQAPLSVPLTCFVSSPSACPARWPLADRVESVLDHQSARSLAGHSRKPSLSPLGGGSQGHGSCGLRRWSEGCWLGLPEGLGCMELVGAVCPQGGGTRDRSPGLGGRCGGKEPNPAPMAWCGRLSCFSS